ncbi:hypothetical protein FIU91_13050 [Roseivivax sp. THAF30]|nr:hypothetical protein FIU91_13050 [Roseivivax sp. THAF30]
MYRAGQTRTFPDMSRLVRRAEMGARPDRHGHTPLGVSGCPVRSRPGQRRTMQHYKTIPNDMAINQVALPPSAPGVWRKRLPWREHFRDLQVSRQEVDRPVLRPLAPQDDKKGEVNPRLHPLGLRPPSSAQDRFGQTGFICCVGRFNSGKVTTKVAYEIGALEVGRQLLKRSRLFARWASARLGDEFFSPCAELLTCCRHVSSFISCPAALHHNPTSGTGPFLMVRSAGDAEPRRFPLQKKFHTGNPIPEFTGVPAVPEITGVTERP